MLESKQKLFQIEEESSLLPESRVYHVFLKAHFSSNLFLNSETSAVKVNLMLSTIPLQRNKRLSKSYTWFYLDNFFEDELSIFYTRFPKHFSLILLSRCK